MYNDNFLFNYMFLKSKPKKFMSSSKAASLAFQSSAFTSSPVGGFMTANNLFKAEKATKQKKEAEKLKKTATAELDILAESLKEIPVIDETFIKANVTNKNKRLFLAKAKGIQIGTLLTTAEKLTVEKAGGLDKLSYTDIRDKLKF